MRKFLASTALVAALGAPSFAAAEGLSFSAGATLTSRYMANGIAQTTGAAFQPWVEGEVNGFYFGAWLSNTAKSIVGSSSEIDLYFGYRNEVGKFSYDVGYARYFYQNPRVDCCGEIIVNLGYAPTDALSLGVRVAHDPKAKVTNTSVSAGYAINDKISLEAKYGKLNKGGHKYWSVGGSYALNDSLGLGVAYHDTSITKGRAVVSLDYSFSFR
jgi:uncharacterized protein (TIGR02001 family)